MQQISDLEGDLLMILESIAFFHQKIAEYSKRAAAAHRIGNIAQRDHMLLHGRIWYKILTMREQQAQDLLDQINYPLTPYLIMLNT